MLLERNKFWGNKMTFKLLLTVSARCCQCWLVYITHAPLTSSFHSFGPLPHTCINISLFLRLSLFLSPHSSSLPVPFPPSPPPSFPPPLGVVWGASRENHTPRASEWPRRVHADRRTCAEGAASHLIVSSFVIISFTDSSLSHHLHLPLFFFLFVCSLSLCLPVSLSITPFYLPFYLAIFSIELPTSIFSVLFFLLFLSHRHTLTFSSLTTVCASSNNCSNKPQTHPIARTLHILSNPLFSHPRLFTVTAGWSSVCQETHALLIGNRSSYFIVLFSSSLSPGHMLASGNTVVIFSLFLLFSLIFFSPFLLASIS